ncbi:MAG: 30S ribosomal protein S20 [Planctomycetota bacterium]
MPNTASAKKQLRQRARRHERNKNYKSQVHSQVKKFDAAVAARDAEAAKQEFHNAVKVLDKVADKGIIHKKTASRKKSRMQARLTALAAQAPAQSQSPPAATEAKSE